jgi:hypothetical protein
LRLPALVRRDGGGLHCNFRVHWRVVEIGMGVNMDAHMRAMETA